MTSKASLDAAQLASMQACVASSLPNTCSILRNTLVSNGAGGNVSTPVAVHTRVPCRFGPFRVPFLKQLEVAGTREDSKTRWEFVFPFGTDVLITDRIAVDGGFTYEVASHRSPQSFGLYVFYLCELID